MTELLAADTAGIARAASLLRAGNLVAFGTETVYGLGADASNNRAVARLFEAKGRPHFNPLICHYPTAERAFEHVVTSDLAHALAHAFWPGPLTLVLPRRVTCPISLLAGAGLDSLAVRVPRIDAILDSGPCPVGVESTVLDLTGSRAFLLRPGGTTAEAIEAVIGPIQRGLSLAVVRASQTLRSPGLLLSHYAPGLPVRLNATEVTADEALLAFGPPLPGAGTIFQLSANADLVQAASRLFDGLRTLDIAHCTRGIAVMPIPSEGLGLAINDRLERAAAPRDTPL